jgi:predicted dehydrogenase
VDWNRWLGETPKIPFNERHFWHWRCYWRYGTGQAGDLLSHEMDFVQYLLGHGVPDTCICAGLNALLKDDREVPDTWAATYQFVKLGRTVTFTASMNSSAGQPVEICGKDALLRFDGIAHDATNFTVVPEKHNERKDLPAGYLRGKTPRQPNHMEDFFNCVRSRGTPKCGVDEAFVEIATSLMSVESYLKRRMVRWDAVKEEIVWI